LARTKQSCSLEKDHTYQAAAAATPVTIMTQTTAKKDEYDIKNSNQ